MKLVTTAKSEYWPENYPAPTVAEAHKRIAAAHCAINPLHLTYHAMSVADIPEMNALIREWYPFCFEFDAHDMAKPEYTFFACYWSPTPAADVRTEIMLGQIQLMDWELFRKVERLARDTGVTNNVRKARRALRFLLNRNPAYVSHICNIGVVEEARGMGIAKQLIRCGTEAAMGKNKAIVAQTLRVIDRAKGVIALYEKCGFARAFYIPGYYHVLGKREDARFYMRRLNI